MAVIPAHIFGIPTLGRDGALTGHETRSRQSKQRPSETWMLSLLESTSPRCGGRVMYNANQSFPLIVSQVTDGLVHSSASKSYQLSEEDLARYGSEDTRTRDQPVILVAQKRASKLSILGLHSVMSCMLKSFMARSCKNPTTTFPLCRERRYGPSSLKPSTSGLMYRKPTWG